MVDDERGVVVEVRQEPGGDGVFALVGGALGAERAQLAATAAMHSRSRLPGGTITVRATISPDLYTKIEVQDDGGPWNQGMIDPARHHGLDIVRAHSDEWGIDGDHNKRTIWSRFDWP